MGAKTIGNRDLRSFGLIVGSVFAAIGLWPMAFRAQTIRIWPLGLGILLFIMALVVPSILRPIYRVWMTVGETLGWLNSRILLSILYYVLIVPIGAIRRLAGSDPMRRKFDPSAGTYKIPRLKRPASHMQRQY